MRKFNFEISSKKVAIICHCSLLLMSVTPALNLLFLELSFSVLLLTTISFFFGSALEKWLFFAEAKHMVNLCYDREV